MKSKDIENYIKEVSDANNEGELKGNLKKAQEVSFKNFGKKIHFYAPSFMYYKTSHYHSSPTDFPTISVTGESCALNCKHCGGK
ncbi:hypothetical protein KAU85_02750, partial [Candidatus Bathyarchaeota archaeon]|nr:hypothetical protein [Candidatus Bathyarchaeota archaeon]